MTIRPRYHCVLIRKIPSFDSFGRQKFSTQRINTRCDVVHIREGAERTTVREDSSASRGRAEEYSHDARLMFMAREKVFVGDLVQVKAFGEESDIITVEIVRIQRRPDVSGRIHHIEADGNRYAVSEEI